MKASAKKQSENRFFAQRRIMHPAVAAFFSATLNWCHRFLLFYWKMSLCWDSNFCKNFFGSFSVFSKVAKGREAETASFKSSNLQKVNNLKKTFEFSRQKLKITNVQFEFSRQKFKTFFLLLFWLSCQKINILKKIQKFNFGAKIQTSLEIVTFEFRANWNYLVLLAN